MRHLLSSVNINIENIVSMYEGCYAPNEFVHYITGQCTGAKPQFRANTDFADVPLGAALGVLDRLGPGAGGGEERGPAALLWPAHQAQSPPR